MLNVLQRIVQEINSAHGLDQALARVVGLIKNALTVDVVSVFLALEALETGSSLLLLATDGLHPQVVGKLRLGHHEGLVGLVAERAEPVNLGNAQEHPRYRYVPESGEGPYRSFCGVPIIYRRRLLGVLVVQRQAARALSSEKVAFLITIAAQIAAAVSHAEACGELSRMRSTGGPKRAFEGISGSSGIAVGIGVVLFPPAELESVPDRPVSDIAAEVRDFRQAVAQVAADLEQLSSALRSHLSAEERLLFDAYRLLLGGNSLVESTVEYIRAGNWAPGALRQTVEEYCRRFDAMEDRYLRERAEDLRDLARRILVRLHQPAGPAEVYPPRTILVGNSLSVSQLVEVPTERLAGIVTCAGSSSSHVAILARALGVPIVVGVSKLPIAFVDRRELVVDGYRGQVIVEPPGGLREELLRRVREEEVLSEDLRKVCRLPATTADGLSLSLQINTGLLPATDAEDCGADGVGLYRSEILFQMRDYFPGEDEQRESYRRLLAAFRPRPVVMRTLDIGGDKPLPYFPISEENPFLGWRGIRVCLDHPEIFLTQLRAMLAAHVRERNLQILFPMISGLGELDDVLGLVRQAYGELRGEGLDPGRVPLGVMIEVPSAVYLIDAVLERVDFVSVGTNDLTQYLLAVDRNNQQVAGLYDALHPAVLMALERVAEAGKRAGKPVSVCGELAGDPLGALALVGLGYRSLSMSSANLPRVKRVLRSFSVARLRSLAGHALSCTGPAEVRGHLLDALEEVGLSHLVRGRSAPEVPRT